MPLSTETNLLYKWRGSAVGEQPVFLFGVLAKMNKNFADGLKNKHKYQ